MEDQNPDKAVERSYVRTALSTEVPGNKTYTTVGREGQVEEVKIVSPVLDTDPTRVARGEATFRKIAKEEPKIVVSQDEIPTNKDNVPQG